MPARVCVSFFPFLIPADTEDMVDTADTADTEDTADMA